MGLTSMSEVCWCLGQSTAPERHGMPPLSLAIVALQAHGSSSRPRHCPAKLHEQGTEIWGWTTWPELQEGRLKLGHLKNELCWVKPAWVAVCPEVEHLLSPGPVLMPRASMGHPRLGSESKVALRRGGGWRAPGRGTCMVTSWLTWGLLQGD